MEKDKSRTMVNRREGTAQPDSGSRAAANGKFSLITNEKLIALYTNLLKCRALSRQPGANGAASSMRRQEAALVGATIDLGPEDAVCFHEHGFLTGFSTEAMIADIFLRAGNDQSEEVPKSKAAGRNGASASAYTHAAIGTALANKTRVNKKVALVFSAEETAVLLRDALHVAVVHQLPMVFVHQAEGDAEKALRRSEGRKKKASAEPQTPWFPDITVDRDDVVAMHRVAHEAIFRARLGRGPTLIACVPFRVNAEGPAGNRRHGHDPIRHMEHYLRARGLFHPDLIDNAWRNAGRAEGH
jgi:TPP-dependent pyruvate/acetoin dehydrogenase alpha subunit